LSKVSISTQTSSPNRSIGKTVATNQALYHEQLTLAMVGRVSVGETNSNRSRE